jgi:hypothetical protein
MGWVAPPRPHRAGILGHGHGRSEDGVSRAVSLKTETREVGTVEDAPVLVLDQGLHRPATELRSTTAAARFKNVRHGKRCASCPAPTPRLTMGDDRKAVEPRMKHQSSTDQTNPGLIRGLRLILEATSRYQTSESNFASARSTTSGRVIGPWFWM